jgi:beta-xylosidase
MTSTAPLLPTNPLVAGHHADPEMRFYDGRCWIYATRSFTDYARQRNLDVFSSADLQTWEKHQGIVVADDFSWITKAVWAPTVHRHSDGRYYLVFASNDITRSGQPGGLEIAVADRPEGPFHGFLGRPLLNEFVHGAQPIDAHLFEDSDGTVYLFYGGWGHCNVARMNRAMDGFVPWPDGSWFREVTPPGYTEAPCMILRDGTYHLMWSSGNWANASYHVSVARAPDPLGPFDAGYPILQSHPGVIEGPGHHSCARHEGGTWLIAYHRRIIGNPDPGARELCLDRLEFEGDRLLPVLP